MAANKKEFIDAPYNFVPLAERVYVPDWAPQVSHDVPFRDGLSGTIDFTLTAYSSLLVGGGMRKATEREPGEVKFFQAPDGRYLIPGSGLRGMIRNVVEILSFSRFRLVDDRRYGLRDISGKYVAESYTTRVRNNIQYGFLRLGAGGNPEIVPCEMARLSHRDLEKWWGETKPIFRKRTGVPDKYQKWNDLCKRHNIGNAFAIAFKAAEGQVTTIGNGPYEGFPVFTGQISDSTDDARRTGKLTRGKYHDFFFFNTRESERFNVHEADSAAWRDFLLIHGDEEGKAGMPWPDFWKRCYFRGERVPVFYIRSATRLQIGLAFMPKLAGDFSIHDMIRHTSADHLDDNRLDMATLIFGRVGEKADDCLKGRVFFEPAFAQGNPKLERQPNAILGSPKASYFPNYIEQPVADPKWSLLTGAQYATYIQTQKHTEPCLRGWKRYPARPNNEVAVQQPEGDQVRNKKIQVQLHTLPSETVFQGRMIFHNLKPVELGALLWAMTFGGDSACRHGLGMGKPFGFGQVSFTIDKAAIEPNDPEQLCLGWRGYLTAFKDHMDTALGVNWLTTPQVQALIAMADPAQRNAFPGKLKHMRLTRIDDPNPGRRGRKITINEFLDAKQEGLALAAYMPKISAGGPSRSAAPTPAHTVPSGAPNVAHKTGGSVEWHGVTLQWTPGKSELSANNGPNRAFVAGKEAQSLRDSLDEVRRARLAKNKLKADLTVEPIGGKNWKIMALRPWD